MKTEQVIAYFGTQLAVANALCIKQPSVAEWGEYPPPKRQLQLAIITQGKLKIESDVIPRGSNSARKSKKPTRA